MKIKLSPITREEVLRYSSGQVYAPDTINHRSGKPIPGGLFCQKIFGPIADYQCECGKLSGRRYKGITCTNCGVLVTTSSIRCKRMGHIDLPIPVVNPFAMKAIVDITGIKKRTLEKIIYTSIGVKIQYTDKGNLVFKDGRIGEIVSNSNESLITVFGPYGLYELMTSIDLEASLSEKENQQLRILLDNNLTIEDLFLTAILVVPPEYRPILKVDNSWVIHNFNDLYLKVLTKTVRIAQLKEYHAPFPFLYEESLLLQKSIDGLLIIGGSDSSGRPIRSRLSHIDKKEGLVRGNLLGKRCDFSGRSVITSGPNLHLNEIGLPRKMAYELFTPFILRYLLEYHVSTYGEALHLYRGGKSRKHKGNYYDYASKAALRALEAVVIGKKVLMNRAPTLHRYGVMAFDVVLTDEKVIRVHPLVCGPFNADFDGDQVAIHLPLSKESQQEARQLMTPDRNLLGSSDGKAIIVPSHEMVLGIHYMTSIQNFEKTTIEKDYDRLVLLHERNRLKINEEVFLYKNKKRQRTCLGRLILSRLFGQEITKPLGKSQIKELVSKMPALMEPNEVLQSLDEIMRVSLRYATKSSISLSIEDFKTPSKREELFEEAENFERRAQDPEDLDVTQETATRKWMKTISSLESDFVSESGKGNPLVQMLQSGARVSMRQVSQLVVSKGIFNKRDGTVSERPVEGCLRDGLTAHEYFQSTPGSRGSLADKHFATPASGYLTNRLVNAARDLYIVEYDCGVGKGIQLPANNSIIGRFFANGKRINKVPRRGPVIVRSPIHCESVGGICAKCYGTDPATNRLVKIGTNIGVIAAHSVSEPTTQMTMRTFHNSGSASLEDSPLVVRSFISGTAHVVSRTLNEIKFWEIRIKNIYYRISNKARLLVKTGDTIKIGQPLAEYREDKVRSRDMVSNLFRVEQMYELSPLKRDQVEAIVALESGLVTLEGSDNTVVISINGNVQGTVEEDIPIFVANGELVSVGTLLNYGTPNIKKFYKNTEDLSKTYTLFNSILDSIYKNEGLLIAPVHFEVLFRAMSDIVEDSETKETGLFSQGSRLGKRQLLGVKALLIKHPSWIRTLEFGWVKQALTRAVSQCMSSCGLPSEEILTGKKTMKET